MSESSGSQQQNTANANANNAPFTAAQMQALATMLDQAFDRRDNRRSAGAGGGNDPPVGDGGGNQNQLIPAPTETLRSEHIGYFDPSFEEDKEPGASVVNAGRHVFYRDVFVFTNRLRDLAAKHTPVVVAGLTQGCLRGEALIWYTAELSEIELTVLRTASLDQWCTVLINQFKERCSKALRKLQSERYTITDARDGRSPRSYVQNIIRHAKAADMNTLNQLTMAWNNLAFDFRRDIPEPTASTSINTFMNQLDSKAGIWEEFAQRAAKFNQRKDDYEGRNFKPSTSRYQQNTANYPPRQSNQARALPPGAERRLIGASGNASKFVGKNQSSNQRNDRNAGRKNQRSKGKAYVVDDQEGEPSPEEDAEEPEDHGDYYANEDLDYYEPRPDDDIEDYFGAASVTVPAVKCGYCHQEFPSKNLLHSHLGNPGKGRPRRQAECSLRHAGEEVSSAMPSAYIAEEIIESVARTDDVGTGHAFRNYHYAMAMAKLAQKCVLENICLDTGCSVSLIDRAWLKECLPEATIRKMASPITVRGLGSAKHQTDEYVILPIYFPGKSKDGTDITAKTAPREIHLVDELKAKMLVGMDIMKPEGIDILTSRSSASISSCKVEVPVELKPKGRAVRQPVHARKAVDVPPHSQVLVPVHFTGPLPDSRDFLFEPEEESHLSLYAHLVDSSLSAVLARNDSDLAVKIPRNHRMGMVAEADFDSCYHASSEDLADLAARQPRKEHQTSWIKRVFNKVVTASAIALLAVAATSNQAGVPNQQDVVIPNQTGPTPELTVRHTSSEVVLPNGVTIHGGSPPIAKVANDFPKLWKEGGFADIPQEEWMRIPLCSDWEDKIPKTARIYPLSDESRAVVDKTFDKLHAQGRMGWTNVSTPFSYPVFVVWKTQPNGERKGRAVVDIRGLNAITQPDVYPLPLQSDLIACVKGCPFISVIDCASFFYQWRVHPNDRHKLTVVTHRGQESFNVAVMGYKNSPAYVQRQIDRLLRELRHFARAYVDDVVVFSRTLEEHVNHLRQVFTLFEKYGISINPTKAFLGYPSVQLLGQKVDSFGLYTAEDKLKAISRIQFPSTLSQLEIYLGLTGWLRNYVPHYAAITKPLQDRKTELLAPGPKGGPDRKNFAVRTRIGPPTRVEEESFRTLQQALSKPTFLAHFDSKETLYIDLDASKRFGFGAMAYHVSYANPHHSRGKEANLKSFHTSGAEKASSKEETEPASPDYPSRSDVKPILFLSRLLKDAETRYWPTELEIAGIVWVLSKLRHMVESAPKTVVYTDHGAALAIAKQTSLTTSSTDKLNLRLVRASDYIQRFRNIEFRHKPGKQHVVPDALSRLDAAMGDAEYSRKSSKEEGVLDALHGCAYATTSLVEMSPELRREIVEGYTKDPAWKNTIQVLEANDKLGENSAVLPFERDNGLIFKLDDVTGDHAFSDRRLCVPEAASKHFFETAHSNEHIGYAKMYDIISKHWCTKGLARKLRDYLRHCPKCQLYQTRRHLPHGSLQPIQSPPVPFHTLTIDFILALPESKKGYDCMMSVTDKYSRRITLIPGKTTFSAEEWAVRLLRRLRKIDWGLPKVIISDRDRKFLGDLWTALFNILGVKLLYSTAYHPQTDGASERTNQTVETAVRFWLSTLEQPEEWPITIPAIQAVFNNSISAATQHSPNEVIYGFSLNQPSDLAAMEYDRRTLPQHLVRVSANDAIAFAQMSAKFHYDRRHQPQFFREGDQCLLRLHKGYNIPANHGRKYSQQYAGPFRILERIGRLAYRIDVPDHWHMHPVCTVAQLEPYPLEEDPYARPRPTNPPEIDSDQREDANISEWDVERLLNKRIIRKGTGHATEYLVRWKGWGSHWDIWTNAKNLFAPDLIKEYEEYAKGKQSKRIRKNPPAKPVPPPPPARSIPPLAKPASRTRKSPSPANESPMLAVVIPPKEHPSATPLLSKQVTSNALVLRRKEQG